MENIDWLEWEPITTPLIFNVTQHGVFPKEITSIELYKNTNFDLVAFGNGTGYALSSQQNLQAGEIISKAEETIGITCFGEAIKLRGVIVSSTEYNKSENKLIIKAQVCEAEIIHRDLPISTQIDWLINFKNNNDYPLPRSTKRERSFKRERSEGDLLEVKNEQLSISFDHFRCQCTFGSETWPLIVGYIQNEIAPQQYNPGFLEFGELNSNSLPSEEKKQKILASLSFVFGRQLVSIGTTSLTKDSKRVKSIVRENSFLTENHYTQPSQPPLPLIDNQQESSYRLDENKISRVISAVAANMETINIQEPLFFVWLGLTSPLNVRAFHFGAAIESLRDSYYSSEKNKLSTLLVPKNTWKKQIKERLIECFNTIVDSLEEHIDNDAKNILQRKLESLNDKSSNMKYPEFFDSLSLKVGDVEYAAIRERNNPAHGYQYKPSEYSKLPIITDALYTLFNRLVLKMTNASDCYIDYSTLGHPVRGIEEPLGGPNGDGKPATFEQ